MQLIEGTIRSYDWGSRTALAELTGRAAPTDRPEAEMWFGAHPAAPSTVVSEGVALDRFIASDAERQLGAGRESLPFLLKLLAASRALSVQAHPSKAQAEAGFAAENVAGVPLDAFERNYKDDNHKPELVVALTPFSALAGFRPVADTVALLQALDLPELKVYIDTLASGDDEAALRQVFTEWVTLSSQDVDALVTAVVARCSSYSSDANPERLSEWMIPSLETVTRLAEDFPGDCGILCSLLLNFVRLQPGEALYLDAGQLHAYLGGTAVEIMANSDNVLRSGLTSKNVDVQELLCVLTFAPLSDPAIAADEGGVFNTPAPDFRLRRITAGNSAEVTGPAIVLSVRDAHSEDPEAAVLLRTEGDSCETDLASGHAVWVGAHSQPVRVEVRGENSQAFIATPGV